MRATRQRLRHTYSANTTPEDLQAAYCFLACVLGLLGYWLTLIAAKGDLCDDANAESQQATGDRAGSDLHAHETLVRWPSTVSELNSDVNTGEILSSWRQPSPILAPVTPFVLCVRPFVLCLFFSLSLPVCVWVGGFVCVACRRRGTFSGLHVCDCCAALRGQSTI